MKFVHEVLLALSMCLFRWIKVDKQEYLKKGSCNFKNYFYFGIEKVASMPGTCQKLRLVFQPFRSRSKQCEERLSFKTFFFNLQDSGMQKSRVIEYVCMQTKCEIKYIPTLSLQVRPYFNSIIFCPLQLLAHPVQGPIFLPN